MSRNSAVTSKRTVDFEASKAARETAERVIAGGVTSSLRGAEQPWPLYFASAAGARLHDVDGNELIDYVMGYGPMILGHSPRPVIEAVKRQLDSGILFGGGHYLEREAAEYIVDIVPCAERVRFVVTGTEAVQAALRIARSSTGRQKIVKFQGHYHGWLDNVSWNVKADALARRRRRPESTESNVLVSESSGVQEAVSSDLIVLDWNDSSTLDEVLNAVGHEVAAVIMEPVMAQSSGVIPPQGAYLQTVKDLCKRHGIVLIFDEIVTGFRVAPGGAQQLYGVTPDLAVLGKAMASGMPVACVAGRAELFDGVATGKTIQGGTFAGYPLGMAATIATLAVLNDPSRATYERLEFLGRTLIDGLTRIASETGVRMLVQGLPALFSIAFSPRSKITNQSEAADSDLVALKEFLSLLVRHGVRITPRGNLHISTAHTDTDVAATIDAFEESLKDLRTSSHVSATIVA